MDTEKADLPGPDELRLAWEELCIQYCNNKELIDRYFNEILRRYTASRRHYHSRGHIVSLLKFCEEYDSMLIDREVVLFSIFYHDIIYNVLRKDNELRSAKLAVKRLKALQVPASTMEQVKLYIEATKTHAVTEAVTHVGDLQFFLDFDMSILAARPTSYKAYAEGVRKEYRIYPDKLYYAGRKQFLQHCLQTEHIFQTATFRKIYEPYARENITRELESIDGRQN
jgi:predicted metal-dependent HD superfamily phosphohydrolase